MGWLASIFAFFTGGFGKTGLDVIMSLIDKYVSNDAQRAALEAQVTEAWINAQVQTAAIRAQAFGPWAWLMAAVFLPGPVVWWNAVFFDSVFHLGWNILALPAAFYPWMTSLIGALFFIPTIDRTISGMFNSNNKTGN